MNIEEFVSKFKNHPVLFIGTGISLRYLEKSFTWDGLLSHIAVELDGHSEFYLDIKSKHEKDGKYDYAKIAQDLECEFTNRLEKDRNGKFLKINDFFYESMKQGVKISRLKIYISNELGSPIIRNDMAEEIACFKKARKNVASVITTNYDNLIENIFEFIPLIGNDILLSNPYGSVYKIHGCVSEPNKIIITNDDYMSFDEKYELIRAQLLSLFIHNPIIFLGYAIGDQNIKSILKTIFTYVRPNSDEAKKIRNNFLLVEYEKGNISKEITEHDIDLEGFSTIRINKIKTDDFSSIYNAISGLSLPVSAMDIRKVQSVVKEIYSGGDIKVSITEDLDNLRNSDKIIAIGSSKTITYEYQTTSEMQANYFNIIDESNSQLLALIDKLNIQKNQWFPIFGFNAVNDDISKAEDLKTNQIEKIKVAFDSLSESCKTSHESIDEVMIDDSVSRTNKQNAIYWSLLNGNIGLTEAEGYLRAYPNKSETGYRKLLCAYDFKKYASN